MSRDGSDALVPHSKSDTASNGGGRNTHAAQERQRGDVYRNLMQAPFPVAIVSGSEHVIEFANPQMLQAWGKEADIVGLSLLEAMPALLDQPFLGYLDDVFRTGLSYEGHEELARTERGNNRELEDMYFNFVYAALRDANNEVEGILITAFEVTEHVRARLQLQQALEEARQERERAAVLAAHLSTTSERLHAAQEAANIGIFDWDIPNEQLIWSRGLYRLMGLAPGAVKASPEAWTAALLPEDRERGWNAYQNAVASHSDAMEFEIRLAQPSGGSRWVRVSAQLEYDAAGAPRRVLGAVVDIQVLKEAAAARALALEEAERASDAKDQFLTTMSHELKTPLNAMLSWATALMKDGGDREQLEHGLGVIERSARTQSRLVSDLLDISRIISGKLRLQMLRSDATQLILAAVEAAQPAADAKGVLLHVELDPDLGQCLVEPGRFQQIIGNLLSNAVKFTPPSGAVSVEADRLKSSIVLSVQDTGPGIATEDLPTFFEQFERVDASTTRAEGGRGLGLAIVRHLTEAHGGTVSVHSAGRGLGATFTVSLPLHPDSPRGE